MEPEQTILSSTFDAITLIGRGHEGNVYAITRADTGARRALKIIPKILSRSDKIDFKQEISILEKVDHSAILKLFNVSEDGKFFIMETEFLSGGDLFDRIVTQFLDAEHKYTESYVVDIMRRLISPIEYLHSLGIAHRDIKPENFVLREKGNEMSAVLIDFGFAIDLSNAPDSICERKGTLLYMPPEAFNESRTKNEVFKGDIYALGVICFELLTGKEPLNGGKANDEVVDDIVNGRIYWDYLMKCASNGAVDFVAHLLDHRPMKRPSASLAGRHDWMTGGAAELPLDIERLSSLKCQRQITKALERMLHHVEVNEWEGPHNGISLKDHFNMIDSCNTGKISMGEIQHYLVISGYPVSLVQGLAEELMETYDISDSGFINYEEFFNLYCRLKLKMDDGFAHAVFDALDKNRSDVIERTDLEQLFGTSATEDILQCFDLNNDGTISFKEFRTCLAPQRGDLLNVMQSITEKKSRFYGTRYSKKS